MKPKMAKAHSKRRALEFVRPGWTLQTEFIAPKDDEPYEYLLVWDESMIRCPSEAPKKGSRSARALPCPKLLSEAPNFERLSGAVKILTSRLFCSYE